MIRTRLRTLMWVAAMAGLVGLGWVARAVLPESQVWARPANADAEVTGMGAVAATNRSLPVRVLKLGSLAAPDQSDRYRGIIDASKVANLSFRRGGRVAALHVREGDRVEAGQLLATLETDDVEATIRGIRSRIAEAEAVLAEQVAGPRPETIKAAQAVLNERKSAWELAKITLQREERLLQSSASSRQAYDEARTAVERSVAAMDAAQEQLNELLAGTRQEQINAQTARVDSLKAQLEDLEVQLSDCRLKAPFAGVIALRFVDEGIIASPERSVFRLLQIDPLEARFGVSAEDAATLQVGQQVSLIAGQTNVSATVSRIEPELDQATRTQGIIVSVRQEESLSSAEPTNKRGLIPGQTVSLSFSSRFSSGDAHPGQDESVWVPIQSLSRSVRGLWSILKVSADQDEQWLVERHIVQVLEVNGNLCRIQGSTVRVGDLVVSEGIHRLTPGMKVEPMTSESSSLTDPAPNRSDDDATKVPRFSQQTLSASPESQPATRSSAK